VPLVDLFGFITVLLRGATLALEALIVGGVLYSLVVARAPLRATPAAPLIHGAAIALVATQITIVAIDAATLALTTGARLADVAGASFVITSGIIAVGALAVLANWRAGAALVLVGSVLSSHAVARLDHRAILTALTTIHHLATAAWIGGLPYLLRDDSVAHARRFSRLAMASVSALVFAGIGLCYYYIGSPAATYGTSYGLMVLAKVALLTLLLILGGLNFVGVRRRLRAIVGRLTEAEIGIGFTVILAAASLTAQPPGADVPRADRVPARTIAARLTPKRPRLSTPPIAALARVPSLGSDSTSTRNSADEAWSEYNHHWAGIIVLLMGVLAVLARWPRTRWARHWPLTLLLLAAFLLIRSDPENWPLGNRGFWESFQVTEVAQHRVFVLLVVVFAMFEWGVRVGRLTSRWAAMVFPLASAAAAALLITHAHDLADTRDELLAGLTHTPLALLAVLAAWSRWLELRLPAKLQPIPARVWPLCFVGIGTLLLLYRETA
jgi:copper resistance protein D